MPAQVVAAPPDEGVKPFNEENDAKIVKMLVGQGVMEGLAHANRKTMLHPITIFIWFSIALAIDFRMQWFPKPGVVLSYFAPLIGFGLVALPLLGIVEYYHRPSFSKNLRKIIGSPDMVAIARYYSLDPRSCTLILRHKEDIVGFVAIDGKRAGEDLGTVLGSDDGELGKEGVVEDLFEKSGLTKKAEVGVRKRTTVGTVKPSTTANSAGGNTVQIRHLDVDQPYRRAGIATELLVSALDHTFGIATVSGPKKVINPAERVIVLSNPFSTGDIGLFRKFGFESVKAEESSTWEKPTKFGVFGWKGKWFSLSRSDWAAKRETLFSK